LPEIVGALNQTYGTGKGERLYQHIVPKVFIEQTIEPRRGSELDEFKLIFHYGHLLCMYVGSSKEAEKKFGIASIMNKIRFTLGLMTAAS